VDTVAFGDFFLQKKRITAIKRLRLAGSIQILLRKTSLNHDVIRNITQEILFI